MTLAQQAVSAFKQGDVVTLEDAISWGATVEDMEEDGLLFLHFSDGSTAGYRKTDRAFWVQEA